MTDQIEVRVPDLGDLAADVTQMVANVGAQVAEGDVLLQLESDKAVLEVTSPCAGRITEVLVEPGNRVSTAQVVVKLARGDAAESSGHRPRADATPRTDTTASGQPTRAGAVATAIASRAASSGQRVAKPDAARRIYAGPAVRRLARELGVDLGAVSGSGPRARILMADVKLHVRNRASSAVTMDIEAPDWAEDFEKFGSVEYQPLTRVQKVSARRLRASWVSIPHVTQHNEADITDLEATRQSLRQSADRSIPRLTLLPFLLRAVAIALREMPRFNSSLCADGERLAIKQYFNVGFAADTPRGLVVPVVRNVDQKDIFEIASELASLSADARAGRLTPGQMQGATFTVSSLGGAGGTHFTPIVNPPEVAILGAGRARLVTIPDGRAFVSRLMLPMSLSYDHRVIDGVAGVLFSERVAALLADPVLLMSAVP